MALTTGMGILRPGENSCHAEPPERVNELVQEDAMLHRIGGTSCDTARALTSSCHTKLGKPDRNRP